MKKHSNDQLLRHLAIVVVLKVVALALLWWVFFREPPVSVGPDQANDRHALALAPHGEPN